MASARVEQALERLQGDESLTGDLADPAATALLAWVMRQIEEADRSASAFDDRVAAIRRAARSAARSGDDDPSAVVAHATAALSGTEVEQPRSIARASAVQPASSMPASPAADPTALLRLQPTPPPVAESSVTPGADAAHREQPRVQWAGLRRRFRRWIYRKDR